MRNPFGPLGPREGSNPWDTHRDHEQGGRFADHRVRHEMGGHVLSYAVGFIALIVILLLILAAIRLL